MAKKKREPDSREIERVASQVMEYVQMGVSLKDIEQIPEEKMEDMYACAYYFYQERKLDEAENLFKLLCMYDMENADYVIGLGAVHQIRKNYQKACDFYALAYVMADNNYQPMLYGGQCQLLMGNMGRALQCFENVVEKCSDTNLVNKAKIYINAIQAGRESRSDNESDAQ